AGGRLAERAHAEAQPVVGPGFLVDRQQMAVVRARTREAALEARDGLLAPQLVGDRHGERRTHGRSRPARGMRIARGSRARCFCSSAMLRRLARKATSTTSPSK